MNHDWNDPLGLCSKDNFHVIKQGSSSTELASDWYNSGNNTAYTKFMLMDWVGAVSEVKEPETKYSILASKKGDAYLDDSYAISKDSAHVQDVYVINSDDKDIMKEMILKYGAVGISYFSADSLYYDANKFSYYNNVDTSTNHAVAAVGWDDNFDKSNFKIEPPDNGAWLIRNSWGDRWGDGGYFWISYYDTSLSDSAYAVNAVSKDDIGNYYDHNYQYDGGISKSKLRFSFEAEKDPGVEEANIFTAKGKEILKAVAIYTDANYDYEIKIYKGLKDKSNPLSGTEITSASISGNQKFEGYHTVKLKENVPLDSGNIFSVVVTLKNVNKGSTYFAIDGVYKGSWIYSDADAQEGESFYRAVGSSTWKDLAATEKANLRIKAYTINDVSNPITDIDIKEETYTMKAGDIYQLSDAGNMSIQPSNHDDIVIYSSDNEDVAKVATNGAITAVRPGEAIITASAFAGFGKDSIKINVSLQKPAETITLSEEEIMVSIGNTKKIEAVLKPEDTDDYVCLWSSSDSSVAVVSKDGTIEGLKEGTAIITATTVSGKSANCTVNVKSRTGDIIECTFDKLPKKLYKYNTYKISLSNAMKKLSPEKIEWKVGKGIEANIVITPVGEDGKDGCELYVQQVASSRNKGEKLRMDAAVTYTKTSRKSQIIKTKLFKRSATSYNMSYDIKLDKESISFTAKKSSIILNAIFNEGKPDDQPTNTKLKWMVTNAEGVKDRNGGKIISVNGKGIVKPKGPGIAYVTVFAADSYDKPSKSYKVKKTIQAICVPVTTVKFSTSSLNLKQGETAKLRESIIFNEGQEPYNKDGMKLKWSSNNKKNVSVNSKGVIKVARKAVAGTYTIKVQAIGGVPKGQTAPETTISIIVGE